MKGITIRILQTFSKPVWKDIRRSVLVGFRQRSLGVFASGGSGDDTAGDGLLTKATLNSMHSNLIYDHVNRDRHFRNSWQPHSLDLERAQAQHPGLFPASNFELCLYFPNFQTTD